MDRLTRELTNRTSHNASRVSFRLNSHEEDKKSTALKLEAEKEVISHLEHPSKESSLNLAGNLGSGSKSTVEESIRNAYSAAYGIPAHLLSVSVDKMDNTYVTKASGSDVTVVDYTVTAMGQSYKEKLESSDMKTIASNLSSSGLKVELGEITPYLIQTSVDESVYIPSFVSSASSDTTAFNTGSNASTTSMEKKSQWHEDTIHFRGNISDNYQPLVQRMIQSSMNKSTDDTSASYVVKIIEKTVYVDRASNNVVAFNYKVKDSAGGPPPSLMGEQKQTFTNQITIELQNTNVFKQDEVALYTGSVQDLTKVQNNDDTLMNVTTGNQMTTFNSNEGNDLMTWALEPKNSAVVDSHVSDSNDIIVTTVEPSSASGNMPNGSDVMVNTSDTYVASWSSSSGGTGNNSLFVEPFVNEFGNLQPTGDHKGEGQHYQEMTYHSHQMSTQVFHIQKDVFSDTGELKVVHGNSEATSKF